jgi:adenylylsulfate kinase-like enzyme
MAKLSHTGLMPTLVAITGPIASGKNTVAEILARRCESEGLTVVIADVDDVAAMVTGPGAAASGLWFAAHLAHGAMVAQWMLSKVNVVISVGPIYTLAEQEALFGQLPAETCPCRVLIDAPLSATWERARADVTRGLSRQYDFHVAAHERFRSLMSDIPSDLVFNSGKTSPDDIADAIWRAVNIAD